MCGERVKSRTLGGLKTTELPAAKKGEIVVAKSRVLDNGNYAIGVAFKDAEPRPNAVFDVVQGKKVAFDGDVPKAEIRKAVKGDISLRKDWNSALVRAQGFYALEYWTQDSENQVLVVVLES